MHGFWANQTAGIYYGMPQIGFSIATEFRKLKEENLAPKWYSGQLKTNWMQRWAIYGKKLYLYLEAATRSAL